MFAIFIFIHASRYLPMMYQTFVIFIIGRLGGCHRRARGRTQPPVRLQMLLLVLQLQQEVLLLHHDLPVRVVDGVLLGLWVCAVDLLSRLVLHTESEAVPSWLRPDAEILGHLSNLLSGTVVRNMRSVLQQNSSGESECLIVIGVGSIPANSGITRQIYTGYTFALKYDVGRFVTISIYL